MRHRVMLSVTDLEPEKLPLVMEKLNHVATGLALEGLNLHLAVYPDEDWADEDEPADDPELTVPEGSG